MSDISIKNESPAHKYFTQMLNMAEDDLDPFQYRLLAHYVRWSDGAPFKESIRTTAKRTKMSTHKVQATLDELSKMGYLEVYKPTPAEARNGATVSVTILDRWIENISRYQRKSVSDLTQGVANMPQTCVKNDTPPVANMPRLEEQNTEEQENTPRKRVSISKWTEKQLDNYYQSHMALLDELLLLTGIDVSFVHWQETSISQRRAYVDASEFYLSKGIGYAEYTAWLKNDLAWRKPLHITLKDFKDNIARFRTEQHKPNITELHPPEIDLTGWITPVSAYAQGEITE